MTKQSYDLRDRHIKRLRLFCNILSVSLIILNVIAYALLFITELDESHGVLTTVCYVGITVSFAAIALMFVYSYVQILRKMRAFGDQLNSEKLLLKVIFLVFALTYTLRLAWTIFFIFSNFDQYQEDYRFFALSLMLSVLWDALPIGLLMYFHLRNFAPSKKK